MELNDYCKKVENTRAILLNKGVDNIHMLFGMITEIGELIDTFKKQMAYGKDVDWVNVKEEVGDLMWYVAGFCNVNEFNLEEILDTNVKKLQTRYSDKFSEDAALNRDLDKERKSLEN